MVVIEPFVVAVEWLYMSIFNAPVARRRSPAQLALAAEQQQHVWHALAREVRPLFSHACPVGGILISVDNRRKIVQHLGSSRRTAG